MIGIFLGFLCLVLAIPYGIAVAMPSWRSLLICTILVGGLLGYGWNAQMAAWQSPDFKEERLPLGPALLEAVTISFAAGGVAGVLGLALGRYSGRPRWAGRTTVSLAGFAILFSALAIPAASIAWQQLPVSQACQRAAFNLELADEHFEVPAAPLFDISLGRLPGQGAYDLGRLTSLREFCALTDTGRRQLHVTAISMKFQQVWSFGRSLCGVDPAAWQALFCSAIGAEGGRIDDSDFPVSARVFSLPETDLGALHAPTSSFDDSLSGEKPRPADMLVRSTLLAPDGQPLTFACSGVGREKYSCVATYPWRHEAHLSYEFRSDYASIEERGRRVDATTRDFVARMQAGTLN